MLEVLEDVSEFIPVVLVWILYICDEECYSCFAVTPWSDNGEEEVCYGLMKELSTSFREQMLFWVDDVLYSKYLVVSW